MTWKPHGISARQYQPVSYDLDLMYHFGIGGNAVCSFQCEVLAQDLLFPGRIVRADGTTRQAQSCRSGARKYVAVSSDMGRDPGWRLSRKARTSSPHQSVHRSIKSLDGQRLTESSGRCRQWL